MDINQIIQGDALSVLKSLPDGIVQTCVTSPPYFGLRDYGIDGQIGLENSPEKYVAKLVEVFSEVRRVLRDDGVCWLNIGDSYAGGGRGAGGKQEYTQENMGKPMPVHPGFKPKDLMMIPARVALALQADGWWIRSDCVWFKPNCLPESVEDRPTKSHEYIFLLSKSSSYYYDADAIREPLAYPDRTYAPAENHKTLELTKQGNRTTGGLHDGRTTYINPLGRNKRSVWSIPTKPYSEAHFATMPPKLVEPCILAGTSPRACEHCLAPWQRVTERIQFGKAPSDTRYTDEKMQATRLSGSRQAYRAMGLEGPPAPITTGWQPTCTCSNEGMDKCIVLDPFMGAGTVALVAIQHGRNYLGIELNSKYVELAEKRIAHVQQNLWSTSGSEALAV